MTDKNNKSYMGLGIGLGTAIGVALGVVAGVILNYLNSRKK